ncbi:MAG TPA: hydroxylamine reductase [Lentisphaeria bacterium]|nr:MAG: hydroxylamine reductase [Lentisphaerae bacterium GWF2_38_69]HBM17327.1 hydroxylamine reductase [Lentisphaeria bacterium]
MFCYQCQETASNKGCKFAKGVCGKPADTAELMDVLVHVLKGVSLVLERRGEDKIDKEVGRFMTKALFTTITNANFSNKAIMACIEDAFEIRSMLIKKYGTCGGGCDPFIWYATTESDMLAKAKSVGVLSTENEDIRSLRELLIYGMKGLSAYAEHASVLGYEDEEIYAFLVKGLASTTKKLSVDEMIALVLECGKTAVTTMALLDKANTTTYGNPEITKVNIGVKNNPGILISGHDLKDMEELLEQTKDTGVDVYTHSEMLPANYYPAFKKYPQLVGNYGGSWWHQNSEFEAFNGPILMTTNCIVPVKDSYKNRIFTTGAAGYPGVKHIIDRKEGGRKDFSEIIALAKTCPAPTEIEKGEIIGGFAHNQVMALADKVVAAVKSGAIKKFVVMGGCDGRQKDRLYFTEVAEALPKDTIILTAGCAKYRYIKKNLGNIGGIPRVLDAGQCNDCYSLAVIALKLQEVFGLKNLNDLPIAFDIAWYEQKAVAVLLALLALGVKGLRLGPTIPAFLSPTVVDVLVKNFDIKPITDAKSDVKAMMD